MHRWKKDVMTKGTHGYFQRDPVGSWEYYLGRFEGLQGKLPNDGHRAIAQLEGWYADQKRDFLLITQNIDGLHEAAGSQQMLTVHGTASRVRCSEVDTGES